MFSGKKNLQFLRYRLWRTEIGNFWSIFALLLPWKLKKSKFWKDNFLSFWVIFCPSTLENQNFEKLKKTTWDVIILHMNTINDNHMMHGSWNMECKTLNLLSVWIIFCPFTPLTIQKITILKKKKKTLRYYHFTNVYHQWQSYDVWFLRYGVQPTEFFVILDCFLPFYTPNNSENQNFEEIKKHLEISSFYPSVPKVMIICYTVPEIQHNTDVIFSFHFGLFFPYLPL